MGLNRFNIILENCDFKYKILILEKIFTGNLFNLKLFWTETCKLKKKKYKIFIIRVG